MQDRISDEELDFFGQRLFGSWYRGAFSKDRLRITAPGMYMINLQSSNQKTFEGDGDGTHWTALFVMPGFFFYYDSYGFPPPRCVITATKKAGLRGLYSTTISQPQQSDLCGYYDLYVMYAIMHGEARIGKDGELYTMNGNSFLNGNVYRNDRKVRLFKNKIYKLL